MQELEQKFDEFGRVKEARVVRNPATGESRGFGFVALDHDDEVDDVSVLCHHIHMDSSVDEVPDASAVPFAPQQLLPWRCAASAGRLYAAADVTEWHMQAIKALNGAEWNGRRLLVERARHVR